MGEQCEKYRFQGVWQKFIAPLQRVCDLKSRLAGEKGKIRFDSVKPKKTSIGVKHMVDISTRFNEIQGSKKK